VNAEGSFCVCQALFRCSTPRQVLPSSRPPALGWSRGRYLQPRGLQGQPVPHCSAPQACPPLPAPSAPTSRGAAPRPACTSGRSLATVAPKPLLPHGVTTWCCSLHQPRVTPCPNRAPTSAAWEMQSPAPGEGQHQAPAHMAGCPVGKNQGEVTVLLPSSQPLCCRHCFCSVEKGPGVGRCSADGCRAAEGTAMVWSGEKEPEGPPHHCPQLPEEGMCRGRC